ncbi:hypothetical protein JW948_09585 [bacterium]|nr:hypothetical protein [bacterium]
MPVLDAALAFALTMLLVSTVVSQIVRFIMYVGRSRKVMLKTMLMEFMNDELSPVIEREVIRLGKKVSARAGQLLVREADELGYSQLFGADSLPKMTEVTHEELTEKLKRTELGKKMMAELREEADTVFLEIEKRFDVIGNRFTGSFRTHSRAWAVAVALVLALLLNIDTVNIANSYLRNEQVREGVIAQMDAIVDRVELQMALPDSAAQDTVGLKVAIAETRDQIQTLSDTGIPIGWSYFPYLFSDSDDAQRDLAGGEVNNWLLWVLGILLTAGLAGLGAPFWYDAVTGIAHVTQKIRSAKKTT